ncbi:MAG: SDR family oxidoreductase [Fimbriimonadaceae bacterium]|jgi:3-oxoacyl-[acyl-carrier protein] reductase|nr:SDR family oxidoreductase [Fimbriimonadaceae bacterium]
MDKRVLVTGSSRGIGRAIALRLAKDGWKVALHYIRDEDAAGKTKSELGDAWAGTYAADLAAIDQAKNLIPRVLNDGPLHALVNNAGVYITLDTLASGEEQFAAAYDQCYRVNFLSPAWLIKKATEHFANRGGGKVVNVASRVGHRGESGAACYSASKAALINLTRALAVEQAPQNIQHFAIAPGWVETAMAREGMGDKLPEILAGIPLGRMASPEDCAGAVNYLLRDEASYLSGIILDINGASYLR